MNEWMKRKNDSSIKMQLCFMDLRRWEREREGKDEKLIFLEYIFSDFYFLIKL